MTALLDSPSSRALPGAAPADPPPAGTSSASLAPAVAWSYLVQVASLAVVYGVAAVGDDRHVQRAAALGLAISWAVTSAAVTWLVATGSGRATPIPGRLRKRTALLVLVATWLAMLVAAVDLIGDDDSTGAWMLLATATPTLLAFVAGAAVAGRSRVDQRDDGGDTSENPAVTGSDTDVVETVETAEPSPALHQLVAGEVAATLPTTYPVVIDGDFWEAALAALTPRDGPHDEQGGVALTTYFGDTLLVLGAVFAQQMTATPGYCEFSTLDVDRVRRSIDDLDAGPDPGRLTVTWIHTHPRLGVFLSATDQETARQWRALDPSFTPIVVDASQRRLDKQLGVFDTDGRQMLPLQQVQGLVDTAVAERVRQAIVRTYRADGQPEPLVLLGDPARGGG